MNLLVFGLGFSASAFVRRVRPRFDTIVGTARAPAEAVRDGVAMRKLGDDGTDPRLAADIAAAGAILVSIPPGQRGDPVLAAFGDAIAAAPRLRWIGYLSTIGIYGDRGGGWVDETAPARPQSPRSQERAEAEEAWLSLGRRSGRPVQIFRLAGIYGLGQSPYDKVRDGSARRIVKAGQVFNRIHVDDIAAVLEASLDRPRAGAVYNVADEEPAPPQDVVAFAAALAGIAPPREEPFESAAMSPMARSFYAENKRASSLLIREELGVRLRYPTYREGLRAVADADASHAAKRSAAGPK